MNAAMIIPGLFPALFVTKIPALFMVNRDPDVEECDARNADQGDAVSYLKTFYTPISLK